MKKINQPWNETIFIAGKVSIFINYNFEYFLIIIWGKQATVKNSRLVYSTDPIPDEDEVVEPNTPIGEQQIKLFLERKAGGKIITIIKGLEPTSSLTSISRELKKICGVGGAVKNREILLQGSHREKIHEILSSRGYNVKLSGG